MKSKAATQLMDTYPLQQWSHNSILRAVCSPITTITKDMRTFGKDLIELMRAYDGVGLAAPQVGKARRIAAFTQRDTSKKDRELVTEDVMINPVILSASKELLDDKEGCLSLPGIEGIVSRPKQITLKYLNLQGKDVVMKASWYNARIILHEIDHLDGVLFVDKMLPEPPLAQKN